MSQQAGAVSHLGKRGLFAISAIIFLDAVGLGVIQPVLPFVIANLGGSALAISLAITVYALGIVVFAPLLGMVGDRLGRFPVLLGTLLAQAASYGGMMLSHSLPMLLGFRALGGAAASNDSIAQSIVTEGLETKDYAKALATLGAVRNVGTIAGPVLGGFVAAASPSQALRLTLALGLVLALGTLLLTAVTLLPGLKDRSRHGRTPAAGRKGVSLKGARTGLARSVKLGLVLTGLMAAPTTLLYAITAPYTRDVFGWGPVQIGMTLAICTAVVVASRLYIVPSLTERLGPRLGLSLMAMIASAGLGAALLSSTGPLFLAAYAVFAAGCSGGLIFASAIVAIASQDQARGQAMGWNQACFALSMMISAPAFGFLYDRFGLKTPFFAGLALMLAAAIFGWLWVSREPRIHVAAGPADLEADSSNR
jgi:DHA1 family tetracycline resistance protein-like MFS transporter